MRKGIDGKDECALHHYGSQRPGNPRHSPSATASFHETHLRFPFFLFIHQLVFFNSICHYMKYFVHYEFPILPQYVFQMSFKRSPS